MLLLFHLKREFINNIPDAVPIIIAQLPVSFTKNKSQLNFFQTTLKWFSCPKLEANQTPFRYPANKSDWVFKIDNVDQC